MSLDTLGQLNWLAVVIATIAYFALGAIWYLPAMPTGRMWMRASGFDPAATTERPGPAIFLAPLIAYFVTSVAMAMLARATGSDTVGEGAILGLVVAIGFVLTLLATTAVFDNLKPEPWTWFVVTSLYNLIALIVVGIIVAGLR